MARNKNAGSGTKVARGKSGDFGVKKRKQARPQKPLNRARKRKIVRWNPILDRETLLVLVHVCNYLGVQLPWDEVAEVMARGITAGAIIQHIAKLRIRHAENGYPVPPPLVRGGGKIKPGSCKPEKFSILKGIKAKESLEEYETGSGTADFVYCLSKIINGTNGGEDQDEVEEEAESSKPKKRSLRKKPRYADEDSEGDVIKAVDIPIVEDTDSDYGSEDETVAATNEEDIVAVGAPFLEEVDEDEVEDPSGYQGSASALSTSSKEKNFVVKLAVGYGKAVQALMHQGNVEASEDQKSGDTERASKMNAIANNAQQIEYSKQMQVLKYRNDLGTQNLPLSSEQGVFGDGSGAMGMSTYNNMAQPNSQIYSTPGLAVGDMFQPGQYQFEGSQIVDHGYSFPHVTPGTSEQTFDDCEASGWTPLDHSGQIAGDRTIAMMEGRRGYEPVTSLQQDDRSKGLCHLDSKSAPTADLYGLSGNGTNAPVVAMKQGTAKEYYDEGRYLLGNSNQYEIFNVGVRHHQQNVAADQYQFKKQALIKTPETLTVINEAFANNHVSSGNLLTNSRTGFCANSGTIDPNMLLIHPNDNIDMSLDDSIVPFTNFGFEDSLDMSVD